MILFVVSTTKRPDIVLYALGCRCVPTGKGKTIARYAESNLYNVSTKKIKGFALSVMVNTPVHINASSTIVNSARALRGASMVGRSLHAGIVTGVGYVHTTFESKNAKNAWVRRFVSIRELETVVWIAHRVIILVLL